jgi:hypothetical protein
MSQFPLKAFSFLIGIGLMATNLAAQDFSGTLQQDPKAGFATYDFNFDGPPKGFSGLFLGHQLLPSPIPIPGGPLLLDPRNLFILPPVQLDPKGKGGQQIQIPDTALLGITLESQAWFLDQQFNFVIPNKFVALAGAKALQVPAPKKPSYAMAYDSNGSDAQIQVWGTPGAKATITLKDPKGKVIGSTTVTVGPKGKSKIGSAKLSQKIAPGSTWSLEYKATATSKPVNAAKGRF